MGPGVFSHRYANHLSGSNGATIRLMRKPPVRLKCMLPYGFKGGWWVSRRVRCLHRRVLRRSHEISVPTGLRVLWRLSEPSSLVSLRWSALSWQVKELRNVLNQKYPYQLPSTPLFVRITNRSRSISRCLWSLILLSWSLCHLQR